MFSDPQIVALASELNHLLWTTRTPEEFEQVEKKDGLDRSSIPDRNMQCAAHAGVCAALMHEAGERVVARAGYAYAINPKEPEPFNILRHYWITISTGLMDLSLDLAPLVRCNPVIYRNTNLTDQSWKVVFKHDLSCLKKEIQRLHSSTECGILYCTVNRRAVSSQLVQHDLAQVFPPAHEMGVDLKFANIVRHCKDLLKGGSSVKHLKQTDSWELLASRED